MISTSSLGRTLLVSLFSFHVLVQIKWRSERWDHFDTFFHSKKNFIKRAVVIEGKTKSFIEGLGGKRFNKVIFIVSIIRVKFRIVLFASSIQINYYKKLCQFIYKLGIKINRFFNIFIHSFSVAVRFSTF